MSGFTTNELLYPLTKGDLPGHPFHGNQYEAGAGELTPDDRVDIEELISEHQGSIGSARSEISGSNQYRDSVGAGEYRAQQLENDIANHEYAIDAFKVALHSGKKEDLEWAKALSASAYK